MAFDQRTVDFAIKNSKILSLTTYSYFVRERRYIDRILSMYLSEAGIDTLQNKLAYCIHELAANAHKANTKRLYFKKEGLDIEDPAEYERGMKLFRQSVTNSMEEYHRALKKENLFLKFYFTKKDSILKLAIINNVPLAPQEEEKVHKKISAAEGADDLISIYSEIEDFSEGAGLGIVMIMQMLRNMGFSNFRFRIYSHKGRTVSAMELNLEEITDGYTIE